MKTLALFTAICGLVGVQATASLLAPAPTATGPYWIVPWPWTSSEAVISGAEVYRIGPADFGLGALVHGQQDGLPRRLRDSGAMLVISGSRLGSMGCSRK